MKKIFTFMLVACAAMTMAAKDYTGKLTVSINGSSSTQEATVTITDNGEEAYTFSIMNFVLDTEDTTIGVGNIVLENVPGVTVAGKTTMTRVEVVHIPAGDREDIDFWLGPILDEYGGVPILMAAQFDEKDINVDIDIDMTETALEQLITVNFTNVEGSGDTYEPGDVNRDGVVSGADVTALYNILLQ
ncbi:MAG: calycin-like domain-containing protein [Muribaculaceae bacterium]|nr:calycin-like domain-containing protein [Muribaculaceae bacterium]